MNHRRAPQQAVAEMHRMDGKFGVELHRINLDEIGAFDQEGGL